MLCCTILVLFGARVFYSAWASFFVTPSQPVAVRIGDTRLTTPHRIQKTTEKDWETRQMVLQLQKRNVIARIAEEERCNDEVCSFLPLGCSLCSWTSDSTAQGGEGTGSHSYTYVYPFLSVLFPTLSLYSYSYKSKFVSLCHSKFNFCQFVLFFAVY